MPTLDKLLAKMNEERETERKELRRMLRFACLVMDTGNDRYLGAAIRALETYLKTGRVVFEGRPDTAANRYLFQCWTLAEKDF